MSARWWNRLVRRNDCVVEVPDPVAEVRTNGHGNWSTQARFRQCAPQPDPRAPGWYDYRRRHGLWNPGLAHGPAVHRELQLLVEAGLTPTDALEAATGNAARLLGIGHRMGAIRKGYEATIVLVNGNPLQEISDIERISSVFLKGERVIRGELFEDDKKDEKQKK